ncbi:hypothetical protein [Hymenobacter jeollabukensis]|uniref:Uncharacterized protein n=1 Tax=Hymenobacter jeollabukensis TaxID=2025313 RepID=A0A5R8WS31_9BACT|nr:hypothetical protein [Hymenobacter jeollabukensis]TLM93975.1 hypothetical protein FDY95_08050 [Hymenobacter jeollabukensis]
MGIYKTLVLACCALLISCEAPKYVLPKQPAPPQDEMQVTLDGRIITWTPVKSGASSGGLQSMVIRGANADGQTAITVYYQQTAPGANWTGLQLYRIDATVLGQTVQVDPPNAVGGIAYDAISKRMSGTFALRGQSTFRMENGRFDFLWQ